VFLSGRSYHVAESVPQEIALPDGATLEDALGALAQAMPSGERLPESSLVAVSGMHVGTVQSHGPRTLRDGDELAIVVPVAGG